MGLAEIHIHYASVLSKMRVADIDIADIADMVMVLSGNTLMPAVGKQRQPP